MVGAVSTSETSVNFYQTTQRNIPESQNPGIFTAKFVHLVSKCNGTFNIFQGFVYLQ
jgi:hypothetical protein